MVLVFDEENQDVLAQAVLLWSHVVLGMTQDAGLEDGREVGRRHLVIFRLARKDSEKIQNVQKQLPIQWRKLSNQALIGSDGFILVKVAHVRTLGFVDTNGLHLMVLQWLAEVCVEVQWYDGLRQEIEVAAEDVGSVVNGVPGPVEAFAVTVRRVEGELEFFDPLLTPCQAEDAFNIGCYAQVSDVRDVTRQLQSASPFSLRYTPHFATTIGTYPYM